MLLRASGDLARAPRPGVSQRRRWAVGAAICLTLLVIGLGAYVRLSDAGLGCPDWPGCYGHLIGVPNSASETEAASLAFPGTQVDPARAWKEMVHRYAAGSLGLLILFIFIKAVRMRAQQAQPRKFPALETLLLATVTIQALLGMLTVTELLKPVIVSAHLLGGMLTLALLVALWANAKMYTDAYTAESRPANTTAQRRGLPLARLLGSLSLIAIALQIALGGWVSSNYAALACQGFPACNGSWWPLASWAEWSGVFELHRPLGQSAAGDAISSTTLIGIHWAHRIGALLVTVLVLAFAVLLRRVGAGVSALFVLTLITAQISLGIANVLLHLPLPLAVAHNLGAALLLSACVVARLRLSKQLGNQARGVTH